MRPLSDAHADALAALRAFLSSVAAARRVLPSKQTPTARTATAHTGSLGAAAGRSTPASIARRLAVASHEPASETARFPCHRQARACATRTACASVSTSRARASPASRS